MPYDNGKASAPMTTQMRMRDKMRGMKSKGDPKTKMKEHLDKASEHLSAARSLHDGKNPDESQDIKEEAHGGTENSAMKMLGLGQDSQS